MKVSYFIEYQQAMRFHRRLDEFQQLMRPVNTLLTINLEQLGCAEIECSSYLQASLQRLRKNILRRGCPWSLVWVLENKPIVGVHAHILVHRNDNFLRDPWNFRRQVLKSLKYEKPPARTVRFCKFQTWRFSYEHNLGNLENYLLKGIRPEVANLLELNAKSQGPIHGKRIGWSQF